MIWLPGGVVTDPPVVVGLMASDSTAAVLAGISGKENKLIPIWRPANQETLFMSLFIMLSGVL